MKRRRSDLHTFMSNWVNASRELQFNCNECKPIFLNSKTVDTHMKRRSSDLHPFPSNWLNASGELQFDCTKWNSIFVKLNTFNTHMKKQHFLALGRHRITLRGKLYWGRQLHETKATEMQWMQLYICKIRHT